MASPSLEPSPVARPDEPQLERSERIARGIMLVSQGYSIRAAADASGAHYTAVWRALQRLDGEWEHRDENAWRRATSKAEVVAEMVLNRMMASMETAPANVLPAWGSFAAKVAGWEIARDSGADAGSNVLGAILEKLGAGGRLRAALEISSTSGIETATISAGGCDSPASPVAVTKTSQCDQNVTLLGPIQGQLEATGHTHTHSERDGSDPE